MTTQDHPDGIAVPEEALIRGGSDKDAYISPWYVTTIKQRDIDNQQGELEDSFVQMPSKHSVATFHADFWGPSLSLAKIVVNSGGFEPRSFRDAPLPASKPRHHFGGADSSLSLVVLRRQKMGSGGTRTRCVPSLPC